ncbi:cytochrome P450 315a1, mitochondrial [Tetranychus urticae]|uniref:Cytochrome P450 n=1 Tax=Tetranychus urticae TaxID=32264 RepID=T1K7U8_TETUR|nr:cytochrome P450 315a1, mitochondrial [Tetranychus urticae]
MALKATQSLLCAGYYPSSSLASPTFRKQLTQTWCKLAQTHRTSKSCDQKLSTTLLSPSKALVSLKLSSTSRAIPSTIQTKPSSPVFPTELVTDSCPVNRINDPSEWQLETTDDFTSTRYVGDEMQSQCPFSGSKQFAQSSVNNSGMDGRLVYKDIHQLRCPNYSSAQPFEEMPTPKSYPVVGTTLTLMAFGGAAHLHEYCDSRHKELGPIYREKLGPTECVFIADSSMVQKVYSNEGRFPNHMVPEAWTIYNEITGVKRGLFFMDGPEWERRRKGMNKVFLAQPIISEYTESFNEVVTDVLNKWSSLVESNKDENGRSGLLTQLERELYNWSIESLSTMIFGRRLGCVETSHDLRYKTHKMDQVHLFVQCVQQLFVESAKLTLLPARLAQRFNLPVWQRFMEAADQALRLARSYVEENVKAAQDDPENGSRGVLEMLLAQPQIDQEELIRIIVDLFLAAADTTSHATQWALYLLSKNPEYQEKILKQVESVVGKNGTVREEHLKHFTLVKGVIKETLRLYPVAPFISRKLDRDIVLGGYQIPANTLLAISLYTTGRDEKYWTDAKSFKPERWVREESNKKIINSHASLPFGLGIRSCVGRRVAEVQMQFLLSRIIQKFYFEPGNKEDIGIKLRMITTPESPIHLRLVERSAV